MKHKYADIDHTRVSGKRLEFRIVGYKTWMLFDDSDSENPIFNDPKYEFRIAPDEWQSVKI